MLERKSQFSAVLNGRGERIRTSGPCLPKTGVSPETRGNQPLSIVGVAEQTGKITESLAGFTGVAPEPVFCGFAVRSERRAA